ncbi:hypothetical protein Sjap_023807 [Stephania japonica]|uniref:Uncharacterized protein n=1 Tax=Stephania japonica TaxID=461633 RepID=A0AAP0HPK2_9MAGN
MGDSEVGVTRTTDVGAINMTRVGGLGARVGGLGTARVVGGLEEPGVTMAGGLGAAGVQSGGGGRFGCNRVVGVFDARCDNGGRFECSRGGRRFGCSKGSGRFGCSRGALRHVGFRFGHERGGFRCVTLHFNQLRLHLWQLTRTGAAYGCGFGQTGTTQRLH